MTVQRDGQQVYRLETENLRAQARRLLTREAVPAIATNVDVDAFDRKVVRDSSTWDGRLKAIPAQRKELV